MSDIVIIVILLIVVFGGYILLLINDERKKATICRHEKFIPEELLIKDGEVYLKIMNNKQYKQFRKRVKESKHMRKGE